jgi:PEP-CTERM motif
MKTRRTWLSAIGILALVGVAFPRPAAATPFHFSTGPVTDQMASASRQSSPGKIEIESADDFVLGQETILTHATFTGLIPIGVPLSSIAEVAIEFYRVFPKDSTDPPDGRVLTRVNSPSDVEFADRDSADVNLSFAPSVLNSSFSAQNSVVNGINAFPNQKTGGEGPSTGQEVLFDVTFLTPVDLPADHYFFVPQVTLASGNFLWLSASRPIMAPGTPFPVGATDLQSWIRNADLDPDWSRIGTDIVGLGPQGQPAPTFNSAFSLDGGTVDAPEPATLLLVGSGIALLGRRRRRSRENVAVSVGR